jgi:hypothetical protein
MHGPAHFTQGVDHSCDVEVMRWFAWRFPIIELQSFIACRDWPYVHAHHIVGFEGDRETLVNLGFVSPRMVPTGLRRSRHSHDLDVRCVGDDRLRVRMILWKDAPLGESHPLAALCPTRWPVIDAPPNSPPTWRHRPRRQFLKVVSPTNLVESSSD